MIAAADDALWMRRALEAAQAGRGFVEPNPLVGAVVVREGHLVGIGHHQRFGGPHAEVLALQEAGEAARGATLYVTLEPCCHTGKTRPCTAAILAAGIRRVVAAMRDPFPRVDGGGVATLESAGVTVEVGCEAEAARALNAPYLKRLTTGLPFVTAKWAMTLDGKTATASNDSRWISSEQARQFVHALRGRMDAIIIGIGTALADDPLLTVRPSGPRCPVRVVLDGAARLPMHGNLVRTAREFPVIVAVTARAEASRRHALEQAGCEILELGGSGPTAMTELLQALSRRAMTNVLVEGGGRVTGSFLDAGHIDAVEVFVAPCVEGGDHAYTAVRGRGSRLMNEALRLRDVEVGRAGDDMHIRARLPQRWRIQAGFAQE
jgi:diaminohydroxyphosphoribosylaminopyrimidine deaminase/5-amino-6-(5-phosphoribosylamino)uracil reductase